MRATSVTIRLGRDRRTTILAVLLVIQSLAAIFFVGDALLDLGLSGFDAHIAFEAVVALALVLGVTFGALEMRHTLEEMRRSEVALAAASGALSDVIAEYFEAWGLTPAESDVALLALKGFDIAEIAELRGAAAGTVRAQLSRVYEKAGVSGRPQLLAVFVEDLLGGGVSQAAGSAG
jgi:DNA-binding CsgD family transcriptional regulator